MKNVWDNFEDYSKSHCSAWVATAVIGSAVIGGAVKAWSASKAADTQSASVTAASNFAGGQADKASNLLDVYNQHAQAYLDPYRQLGQTGVDQLSGRLQDLTKALPVSQEQLDLQKPLNIDQATLENLPGYKFTRDQGLKATQNSAAARGLGVSGASLKGAATFATGLADKTYLDQFAAEQANRQGAFGRYQQVWQDTLTGQQTAYDRLMGAVTAGENASAVGASLAQKTGAAAATVQTDLGKAVSNNIVGSGNAQAAATNAAGGAFSDAANTVGAFAAYKGLYGNGAGSTPGLSYVKGTAGDQFVPTFRA